MLSSRETLNQLWVLNLVILSCLDLKPVSELQLLRLCTKRGSHQKEVWCEKSLHYIHGGEF